MRVISNLRNPGVAHGRARPADDVIDARAPAGKKVRINGVDLHVEDLGAGEETVVLSHGFAFSTRMFDDQVRELAGRYRCVAYDHRGQGRSERRDVAQIDLETVYADAVALIEALGAAPCHFVGLSMGGFVGLRLAARRPDLLRSVVLIETTAGTDPMLLLLRERVMGMAIRAFGIRPVLGTGMKLFFGRSFMTDPARADERAAWRSHLATHLDRSIVPALKGVASRSGMLDELSSIAIPMLVLAGEEDRIYPPSHAERIAQGVPGAHVARIPKAGHSSTIEEPDAVNRAIAEFLASAGDSRDRRERHA